MWHHPGTASDSRQMCNKLNNIAHQKIVVYVQFSLHGGRDLQAGQDLHEATQLLVYIGREGWAGYWRVLNAIKEMEEGRRERGEEGERGGERG